MSLWPPAQGPLLLEHQAIPATRVPTKMTGSHRAGLNWPAKQASTVSSGVSPNDERPRYHRESAQMMCALRLGGHLCGWDGLICQTCVHPAVGHPFGGPTLVFQIGPHPAAGHPCGWTGWTCQTGTRRAGLNWLSK